MGNGQSNSSAAHRKSGRRHNSENYRKHDRNSNSKSSYHQKSQTDHESKIRPNFESHSYPSNKPRHRSTYGPERNSSYKPKRRPTHAPRSPNDDWVRMNYPFAPKTQSGHKSKLKLERDAFREGKQKKDAEYQEYQSNPILMKHADPESDIESESTTALEPHPNTSGSDVVHEHHHPEDSV